MSKTGKKMLGIIGRPVVLICIALALATVFLGVTGYNPFAILIGLGQSFTRDLAGTVRWSTPMILSGLAVCVTYKAGVFNLGVDGQIFIGASAAAATALIIPANMNKVVAVIIIFLAAMIAGAAFACIPALMKIYLNVNEVVSTLLLNFIGQYFVDYLVNGPLRDPESGTNLNATAKFNENCWLPHIMEPSSANVGVFIAIALIIVISFVFFKTTFGHEIKIVGTNAEFARYCGVNPKKTTMQVMMVSGAIAGAIGAIEVTAVQHRLIAGFNDSIGFKGIVVSLLANNNPIGVIFSGVFFGALKNGGMNMERMTDVPSAVSSIVEGIVILIISAQFTFHIIKKATGKEVRK